MAYCSVLPFQSHVKEDSEMIAVSQGCCRRVLVIFLSLVLVHLSSLCVSCAQVVGGKPQPVEDSFLPEGDGVKLSCGWRI